ncbi:MAG TPA: EamA family transporter [Gemmatimonadaceae bacterium]|nr:EamA family transporter [Gemmatimonadaceae bacterium]
MYLIWGSTYLGIFYAIQTVPPFLMAGARFFLAGLILYAVSRFRGTRPPTRAQWRNGALAGTLLLLGGNGLVTWAEQRVPSGVTALVVATSSVWMVLIAWAAGAGRPAGRAWAAIACALLGVALLVRSGVDPIGAAALVVSALTWALGTIVARRTDLPQSTLLATAIEMLTGGAALIVAAIAVGEPMHLTHISHTSLLAFLYLVTVGSLVGYSAYTYLVANTTPARLGSYAYVTPVVAVTLGSTIAHEPLAPRTIVATIVIVLAVAILSFRR